MNRRVTRKGGGGVPCPLSKFEIQCLDFGKKCPNYIHLCAKFLIEIAAVKVSRKKISNIFPFGALLSCVTD